MAGMIHQVALLTFCLVWTYADKCGDLTPNQNILRVGSRLVLTCKLKAGEEKCGFDSQHNFRFKVNSTVYPANHTGVTIIDNFTAQLAINASIRDGGFSFCYYTNKQYILVENFIHIGYVPDKVNNIHCMVDNWSSMNCTYNRGRITNIPTNYTLEFCYKWNMSKCFPCPSESTNSCLWSKSYSDLCPRQRETFQDDGEYVIRVRAVNALLENGTVSDDVTVDAVRIVKPAMVKKLSAKFVSATHINISWHVEKFYKPQIFRISYRSKYDKAAKIIETHSNVNSSSLVDWIMSAPKEYFFMLDGLIPFTQYEVNVSAIPLVIINKEMKKSGFWSDNATVSQHTLHAVPFNSPDLLPGSYQRLGCNRQWCKIKLIWPKVKEQYRSGVITGYKMTANLLDNSTDDLRIPPLSGGIMSHILNIKKDGSYRVNLTAGNEEGFTTNYSTIVIPSQDLAPAAPQFVSAVVKGVSTVHLSWHYTDHQDMSLFNVFWCKGKNNECFTKSDLFYKTVPGRARDIVIQLHGEALDEYWFSVSAIQQIAPLGDVSSGMVSSICLYKPGNKTLPPPSFNAAKIQADNTISLTGFNVKCEDLDSVVLAYQISYCESKDASCTGEIHTRNTTTSEYIIHDVLSDAHYLVWAQTITASGRSVKGSAITVATSGLSGAEIAGIVMASLVVSIGIICGLVFCWRKCGESVRAFLQPYHFDIPKHMESNGGVGTPIDVEYEQLTVQNLGRRRQGSRDIEDAENVDIRASSNDSGKGQSNSTTSSLISEPEQHNPILIDLPHDMKHLPHDILPVCNGDLHDKDARRGLNHENQITTTVALCERPNRSDDRSGSIDSYQRGVPLIQIKDGSVDNDSYRKGVPLAQNRVPMEGIPLSRNRVPLEGISSGHERVPEKSNICLIDHPSECLEVNNRHSKTEKSYATDYNRSDDVSSAESIQYLRRAPQNRTINEASHHSDEDSNSLGENSDSQECSDDYKMRIVTNC